MRFLWGSLLVVWLAVPEVRSAEAGLSGTRELVSQWVQTQQLISKTRADGEAAVELLQQTKAIHGREIQGLEEALARTSTNSSQISVERGKAEADLAQAEAALEGVRGEMAGLEAKVRSLVPILPTSLREQVQPILNRIPEDPGNSRAGVTERLQAVVTFLNEVDKFQQTVTVTGERRSDGSGREVSVETLYLGLGAAFFTDVTGKVAGYGVPGKAGWEWTLKPEMAGAVRDALAIYRNAKPAAFVGLPLRLTP